MTGCASLPVSLDFQSAKSNPPTLSRWLFSPKKLLSLIENNGKVEKSAWECALLTAIRDEIKSGNLSIKLSKRFGRFDDFFIPEEKWHEMREAFFRRAALPSNPNEVETYLKDRLNRAFDQFLEKLPDNAYASIGEDGWHLSADMTDKLGGKVESQLNSLEEWLSRNMRVIKLPELLIEVNNELKISRFFMSAFQQEHPQVEDVCSVLATIIAHGCNIGPYTMSHLIEGVSYRRASSISRTGC